MLSPIYPPILTLLVGVISFSMITNHKQTCIIHFVDCRKALHPYFTHHTRKYFGCERRRGLHGGGHVVARVDVLGTTCAAGRPLGLASGKLPSAHIASYEKGRCCQAPPCGETDSPHRISAVGGLYSERPRGAGFRSVNPAERWRENPARALAPGVGGWGGTWSENWWGCAAGRWKLDPKRSREK